MVVRFPQFVLPSQRKHSYIRLKKRDNFVNAFLACLTVMTLDAGLKMKGIFIKMLTHRKAL